MGKGSAMGVCARASRGGGGGGGGGRYMHQSVYLNFGCPRDDDETFPNA